MFEWGADEVFAASSQKNDQDNRALQIRNFMQEETDELLYAVDNDGWHDPGWYDCLMALYEKYGGLVTLFNSQNHAVIDRTPRHRLPGGTSFIEETDDAVIRRTCGGISLLLERSALDAHFPGTLRNGYDWQVCEWYERVITAKQSHVAHIDINGIHSNLNNGIQSGLDPTPAVQRFCDEVRL
jgi:hypothetical protein